MSSTAAIATFAPRSRLLGLPTELLMEIIEFLSPETFINFAFAAYASLQQRLLVPPMTWRIYAPLCRNLPPPQFFGRRNNGSIGATTTALPRTSSTSNLLIFWAWPLPTEITLQVLRRLRPRDLLLFVLGHWWLLPGLLPRITPDTNAQLTKAWAQVEIARRLAAAPAEGEDGVGALASGGSRRRERGERGGRKRAWSV